MDNYKRARWVVVGLWLLFCFLTLDYNGPFFDESIYITAGLRTFEGHGGSDGYLGWFAGSLIWPVLAGAGYRIAGLVGTRAVALFLGAAAFAAVVQAAQNLFGPKASFWTAIALAFSGPFAALVRLGVYDVPALAGMAISFWAITELIKHDDRLWLGIAAVAFTLGLFSKYPMGMMLLPLCGVLVTRRGDKALMDVGIFGLISTAITLAFFLPNRAQFVALAGWQVTNRPQFGVGPSVIAFTLFYLSLVPAFFALGGWAAASKEQRPLATVLVLSLVIWPAYHLLSGNPVGPNKHVVFGFLFAYPLVGLALSRLWDGRWGKGLLPRGVAILGVSGMALLGWMQVDQGHRAWPDLREAADYLGGRVQPGQQLLINESWPYTLPLYAAGRLASPWDVFDVYRVTHGETTQELCEYDWFVDTQGSYVWPESVVQEIEACGHFERVFSTQSMVVGLGQDLNFVSYPIHTHIWKNIDED